MDYMHNITPTGRQNSISYLKNNIGLDETKAIEIENKIYDACNKTVKEYGETLKHVCIDLQKTTSKKRKRSEFEKKESKFTLNEYIPPSHECGVSYVWYYKKNNITCYLHGKDIDILEKHYRDGPSVFGHEFIPGNISLVDLDNFSIDGKKCLKRKIKIAGKNLNPLFYWDMKNQYTLFYSFDIDVNGDIYKLISDNILKYMSNISINFIRQLQNMVPYQRYCNSKNIVDYLSGNIDSKEKMLYYFTRDIYPRFCIVNALPGYKNHQNGNLFYKDPTIASEMAVQIRHNVSNGVKKQLLLSIVNIGESIKVSDIEFDDLKVPPFRVDNIRYNSIYKEIENNGIKSKAYLIQNDHQFYHSFLIDYNIY